MGETSKADGPDFDRLYGVTHHKDGTPIIRLPFVLKVGIGLSRGLDIHVYIDSGGQWIVSTKNDRAKSFPSREKAEEGYEAALKGCSKRGAPSKLPYFTFTRRNDAEEYEPDFDAIEAGGPTPTELDIVFTDDSPFRAAHELWGATERKCHGDGRAALRILAAAATEAERKLAKEAEARGEKSFRIVDGCREFGCKHATGEKAQCSPRGVLRFQLMNAPRLGGICRFETTGFRSITNLHSSISMLKDFTGERVAGIPLKLVLRPYRLIQPGGKRGRAYAVHVEFRPDSARHLKQQLLEAVREPPRSPPDEADAELSEDEQARVYKNEFGPRGEDLNTADGRLADEGSAPVDPETGEAEMVLEDYLSAMGSPLGIVSALSQLRARIEEIQGVAFDADRIFDELKMKGPEDLKGHTPAELKGLATKLWLHLEVCRKAVDGAAPWDPHGTSEKTYRASPDDLPKVLGGTDD